MSKQKISTASHRWLLASCPSTGDEVIGSGWNKQFTTSGGQATWWQCPACGGWHIATVSDMAQAGPCLGQQPRLPH